MSSPVESLEASVLLSYSHDSDTHRQAVRVVADRLRAEHGINAWVDQYDEIPPPRSWPEWMYRKVSDARFVLVICTAPYRRRFEDREIPGRGRGARWEGAIITQELYEQQSSDAVKFIPVLLEDGDPDDIPDLLRGTTHYVLDRDRDDLIRHLEDQPKVVPPPIGRPDGDGSDGDRSSGSDHVVPDDDAFDVALGSPSLAKGPAGGSRASSADAESRSLETSITVARETDFRAPIEHGVLDLPRSYATLRKWFGSRATSNQQFLHMLEVIQGHSARAVLIEPRFFDRGYREEYSAYYARLFKFHSPATTRLHFFADELREISAGSGDIEGYLGSAIIRPVESARLGATYISPPPALRPYVQVAVQSNVEVFGHQLEVQSAPYIQVDAQTGMGCGSAAAWMCHAAAQLRGWVPQASVTDFVADSPGVRPSLRGTYRHGMTLEEIQTALARNGLTNALYDVTDLPTVVGLDAVPSTVEPATRIRIMLLRYLASGLPIIAMDHSHAVVVIGRIPAAEGGEESWVVHDSNGGPYLSVSSDQVLPSTTEQLARAGDEYWRWFCIPLPEGVALAGDAAEERAALLLRHQQDAQGIAFEGQLRTRLVGRADYQRRLSSRELDPSVARLLRVASLPEWIWMVQLVSEGGAMVTAEVLVDAASSSLSPTVVAFLGGGTFDIAQERGRWTSSIETASWQRL